MPAKKRSSPGAKPSKTAPVPDVTRRIRTLAGFLCEFLNQHQQRPDRPFCFILGAGASKESNIPTGQEMAAKWLEEIHHQENIENLKLRKWATEERLGIDGFDPDQPARHYSKLYERRYLGNEDGGYAFLESVMEKSEPSFGYSVLAYILGETPHKIVITTNFDNLVADALAVHADNFPVVVTDDALVRYVRSKVRRPLIAKVHGSLGFTPKSKEDDLRLSGDWSTALEEVFRNYTPVVIGYDGNDGSLMSLLESLPVGVPDRIWWCYYSPSGDHRANALALPERIRRLAAEHNGFLVPVAGFDFLMAELLKHIRTDLKIPDLHDRLREKSSRRLSSYDAQWQKLCGDEKPSATKQAPTPSPEGEDLQEVMRELAKARTEKPWWQWQKEIDELATPEEKNTLYRKAIESMPRSGPLLGSYATFLYGVRHDHDTAEALFKRAIDADPGEVSNLGNYAGFLHTIRKDYDAAEALYKRAVDADPKHANNLGNYAGFLHTIRKDYDAAEALYKRAIEADPAGIDGANKLSNYASFLTDIRKSHDVAETFYKRAIDADPTRANSLSNYANFLTGIHQNHDAAEALYKRAIDADPKHSTNLGNYACFLTNVRKNYDEAELLYLRAIDSNPDDVDNLTNYGQLLVGIGRFNDALVRLREGWRYLTAGDTKSSAELSFSLWLATILSGDSAKIWERTFKACLAKGFVRPTWNFDAMLERAKENLTASEFDYARALADAFLDESKVPSLQKFPRWRQVKPLDPSQVMPDGSQREN